MNQYQKAITGKSRRVDNTGEDPKKKLRDTIDLILPDRLMIVLAGFMIPIVLVPLLVNLPNSVIKSFRFADFTILGVFVVEYLLKASLAQNTRKHLTNPWHLLDLLIVILPAYDLVQFLAGFGSWSPLLRLLRILRVVAVGGRAVDRRMQHQSPVVQEAATEPGIDIRVVEGDLNNIHNSVSIDQVSKYLNSRFQTWVDISSVSDSQLNQLSSELGIPRLVLSSELVEESYPRIDYFEQYSFIFVRIADIKMDNKSPKRMLVTRKGLLLVCFGQNIVTVSRSKTIFLDEVLKNIKKHHSQEDLLVVPLLYTILSYALEIDKQIIRHIEQELIELENVPVRDRPPNFLEATFHLRKEVNQIVPSLLHMKEIATMIVAKRVPLEGFQERHENLFDIIADEATYLRETAENARDNLLSLSDLYINTSSYQLNQIMKVIAVITCFGIIPALAGLFGSNLVGNPWDIELWQLFIGIAVAMGAMAWVFFRLGWLK
jgi:Mg2+ and Co2+ transporter CorA